MALFLQPQFRFFAVISLNFDAFIGQAAAATAVLPQLFRQRLQLGFTARESLDDGDAFTFSALGFLANSDDAVAAACSANQFAAAVSQNSLAVGAEAPLVGTVNRGHWFT